MSLSFEEVKPFGQMQGSSFLVDAKTMVVWSSEILHKGMLFFGMCIHHQVPKLVH